jgi:hypothetical protein
MTPEMESAKSPLRIASSPGLLADSMAAHGMSGIHPETRLQDVAEKVSQG